MNIQAMQGNPYLKREMGIPATVMVLAYEQRTANLLALLEHLKSGRPETIDQIHEQILARLGIEARS